MREKDCEWNIGNGPTHTYEAAQLAVLMDLRDELKRLNGVLNCPNFISVPGILREIRKHTDGTRKNTTKKRRRKVAKS